MESTIPAFIDQEISISAPAARVWEVLTQPEFTEKYMFGTHLKTSWEPGTPMLWVGAQDGVTYVSGLLKSVQPNKEWIYTVFPVGASYEDVETNHLVVSVTISESKNQTVLAIHQGDFTQVPDGAKRYADTAAGGGWATILETIRDLAEGN